MDMPEVMPEAVVKSIERWMLNHNVKDKPDVSWCGHYYGFKAFGMFHGIELDGYLHT